MITIGIGLLLVCCTTMSIFCMTQVVLYTLKRDWEYVVMNTVLLLMGTSLSILLLALLQFALNQEYINTIP